MTEEQRKARKLSAESGNIRWIKDNCLRTKDGDDDYVFISYKSDDFEKVLDDIVYNACKKYGLKVYFDTAFDEDSDSWITQYYDNMCDPHCRAFIAFINDSYCSSYACLLEMMSRKTAAAGGDYKEDSLFFLPINIGSITDIVDGSNTGLGTKRYSNGKINNHAAEELKRFNEIFSEIADDFMRKSIYKRENDTQLYEEATSTSPKYGKPYLTVTQCRRLMERVIPGKNDNDGGNKAFVDVIHDKLINAQIDTVFGDVIPPVERCTVKVINGDKINVISVDKGNMIFLPEIKQSDCDKFLGWFVAGTEKEWNSKSDIVTDDLVIEAKWRIIPPPPADGYKYTIFGKEYSAGDREQGKLMFDAFEALVERYPGCEEKLTQRTSIAKAEGVKKANTQDADPTYFRNCKEFEVNGQKYLVGTSYGFQAKLAEIKGMFKICGADLSEFILNGEPLGTKKDVTNSFEYELWGISHKANSLADMMHDVFILIAKKYASYVSEMADNDSITSVARKSDVDGKKLPSNKMNYFKTKKEHNVEGNSYYVSTRYNREQGIEQLERMLVLCEGSSESFKIISKPDKTKKNMNGKKGIGELI